MEYYRIRLPFRLGEKILACGADMKAGFCLAKGMDAHLFILGGNLANVEVFNKYKKEIQKAIKHFKIKPQFVVYDMHPEYYSSKLALSEFSMEKSELIAIQHHHAHIASCMAGSNLGERVIGVAFDGTGFGDDGSLWGAEFLLADYSGYKRMGHLRYIPLIGAEAAINEPWRLACIWLYYAYGKDFLRLKIDFLKRLNKKSWQIFNKMLNNKINVPLSSSMGRLFDSVASLIGIRDSIEYEAQAAIELERLAAKEVDNLRINNYRFKVKDSKSGFVIDCGIMFKDIVKDLEKKISKSKIALKFHKTVARMINDGCLKIYQKTKVRKVALSGGVFANKILSAQASLLLENNGFRVYLPKELPVSDGGIALGQICIGNAKARN